MRVIRRLLLIIVVILAIVIAGFFTLVSINKSKNYSPKLDTRKLKYIVSGEVYYIPRNYIWYLEKIVNGEAFGANFHTVYPEFTGYTEANKARFEQRGWNDEITFSIKSVSQYRDSMKTNELRLKEYMENYAVDGSASKVGGFQTYDMSVFQEKIYTKTYAGKSILLLCGLEDKLPYPSCNINYNISNQVVLRYTFAKKHLGDWDNIHSSMLNLILSFKESANESSK